MSFKPSTTKTLCIDKKCKIKKPPFYRFLEDKKKCHAEYNDMRNTINMVSPVFIIIPHETMYQNFDMQNPMNMVSSEFIIIQHQNIFNSQKKAGIFELSNKMAKLTKKIMQHFTPPKKNQIYPPGIRVKPSQQQK